MATAAPRPPKLVRVPLHERVTGHAPERVDREAGVIKRVRVIGPKSDNGRVYTREALQKALPLYNAATVKIDHPRRHGERRPTSSTFGWLKDCFLGDDGAVYGDLHFLKSHVMAETVCEAAERNPHLFGFSHDAEGHGHRDGDLLVIDEVIRVNSVDLVDSPATNRSLFEGKQVTTTPTRAYLEALRPLAKGEGVQVLTSLLEMDGGALPADMPLMDQDAPADAPGVDRMAAAKAHVIAAVGELVQSDDPELHKLGMKLMKLLKPDAAPDDSTVTTAVADESKTPEADPMLQQLQEQVAQLQADKAQNELTLWVREQCDAKKLTPDKALLEGLVAMRDRKLIANHLDYLVKLQVKPAVKPPPRSQSPGVRLHESADAVPEDVDAFVRAVV